MAQPADNGTVISPELMNSYGMEIGASEYQQHPAPQLRPDDGASAPQVLNQTHEKPIEYVPYPHQAPEVVPEPGTSKRKATLLGLSKPIFWVIVGLVVLVVFGVALGAGLGVGLSNSNRSRNGEFPPTSASTFTFEGTATWDIGEASSTSVPPELVTSLASFRGTTTPTPTSEDITATGSAPVTKGTIGLAANSCTFSTPKTFYIENTGFTEYCFTDWPNKGEAFDGKGNVTDLTRTTVYTFEACMAACLDYNDSLDDGGTRCMAVTYNSNLTSVIAVGQQGGNCFLKDKRGVNRQGSAESACAALVD
ncbi:hypothetical protein GE09DRAFT_495077 [Coniochaeta sp. 2T2.1]|nr:hypothetical protein GE09DRAFT_495077 [Coniochaeta sp. 2T2.1]